MIQREEENTIGLGDLFSCRLISCPRHRSDDDPTLGNFPFDPLNEWDSAEYLSDGSRMNPDEFLKEEIGEASEPMSQLLSKRFLQETSQKQCGRVDDEEQRSNEIIELINHRRDMDKNLILTRRIEIVVRLFRQFIESFFKKDLLFLEVGPIAIRIHKDRFSPDKDPS